MKKIGFVICLLLISLAERGMGQVAGAIINEVSNGSVGAQEFVELLVVDGGTGACTVDLRGFIVDDNNGDFSCGPRATAGIAQGHLRFSTTGPWSAIPVGSLIVLYNGADRNPLIPADDPTDANGDSVYIVSSGDPSIEVSAGTAGCGGTDIPVGCGSTCPGTGNAGYGVASYTFGGNWNTVGLRNSGGDAAQVRLPSGAYYHGLSYGNSNMTGGPDNIAFPTSPGTGRNYFFNDGDYRSAIAFSEGVVSLGSETPGLANNGLNAAYISGIRCNSILPVALAAPFTAVEEAGEVDLYWATASEKDNAVFVLERSSEPVNGYVEIGRVPPQGTIGAEYGFVDALPLDGQNWYQLWQVDLDGSRSQLGKTVVHRQAEQPFSFTLFPNPSQGSITLRSRSVLDKVEVTDIAGQMVRQAAIGSEQADFDLQGLAPGLYFVKGITGNHQHVEKLIIH